MDWEHSQAGDEGRRLPRSTAGGRARRGSLTGDNGLAQEGLDVLGDDAEHLDHCEPEAGCQEGRRDAAQAPGPS